MLHKTRPAPGERIPLTLRPARAKRRSNASFETKHRPPAAFPGLLSFAKRRRTKMFWREQNHANCREIRSSRGLIQSSARWWDLRSAQGAFLADSRCEEWRRCCPSGSTATQRRGYTISIGREVGSRCFRSGRPAKSRIPGGSSGLAWRFRVRFLLVRSHRCSMRQTLLPQPLPLWLRRIASYGWLADETDA
jgi:hypothetical protein